MSELSDRMLASAAKPMRTWSAGDVVSSSAVVDWADEVAALEARLSKMEDALTEVHVSIIEGGRMMGHLERVAEEALAGESDV